MSNEPNFRDNSMNSSGSYQENRTTIIIFVIACIVPIIGLVAASYGFARSRRLNIGLKLGVWGIIIAFINVLLFTLLLYLWILNGAKL